jgi:transcriptional regulator with XRE-family HTH domain
MAKIKYGTKSLKKDFGDLTFGSAIESERLSRDLTLREFSEILGISVQSLSDLEKGRRIPSPSRAMEIANKLGEPEAYWVQIALQDKLSADDIDLKVTVA